MTTTHEADRASELRLGSLEAWKQQLHDALETETTGAARKLVNSWRQMADKGDSLRPAHANALRTKAFGPPKVVPAKDFEATMAVWDADIARYERATGETLPPAHYRMSVEDMCPERLRNRLRD